MTELHRDDVRVIPAFCLHCAQPVRLVEDIGPGTEMMTYVWPCPWCHQDNEGSFAGVVLAFKRFAPNG